MANLEEGLHGGVNGKLGNLVYQTNHGGGNMEIVARAKATRSSPDDPKMQEQREKIKVAHEEWKKLAQKVRDRAKRASWQGETARTKYIRTVNPYIDDQGNLERQPDWIIRIRREIKEDPDVILNGDLITSFEEDNWKDYWTGGDTVIRKTDRAFSGSYSLAVMNRDPDYTKAEAGNTAEFDRYPGPGDMIRFKVWIPAGGGGYKWLGYGVMSGGSQAVFSMNPKESEWGINVQGGPDDVLEETVPREEWLEGRIKINPEGGDKYRAQLFSGSNFDSPVLSRWTEVTDSVERPNNIVVYIGSNTGFRIDKITVESLS